MEQILKTQIRLAHVPAVAVFTSPDVEEVSTNVTGLPFAQFLQYHNTIYTLANVKSGAQKLAIRFADAKDLEGVQDEDMAKNLQDYVARSPNSALFPQSYEGFAIKSPEDAPYFFRAYNDPAPWIHDWLHGFMNSFPPTPDSVINHPMAVILALPADDESSVKDAVSSLWGKSLPELFANNSFMYPGIPRICVIVRPPNVPLEKAKQKLSELSQAYPSDISLIFNVNYPTVEKVKDAECVRLTPKDYNEFCAFVDKVAHVVKPFIQDNLDYLNLRLSQERKGLGSKLKNLFKGSGHGAAPERLPQSYTNVQQDVPCLTKRLGDFLMLTGDFESAFKNYQSSLSELKSSGSALAEAQEMMCIASFLGDLRQNDAAIEQTIGMYQNFHMPRHQVRTMLFYSYSLQARGLFQRAAETYTKACDLGLDPYSEVLLLEQSGFCYLRITPKAYTRKFAAQIVKAAHGYGNLPGYAQHALRCYLLVNESYYGKGWLAIDDYLNVSIVKHSLTQKAYEDAQHYLSSLVGANSMPFYFQSTILRQLIWVLQYRQKKGEISLEDLDELPLPELTNKSVTVERIDDAPTCDEGVCTFSGVSWSSKHGQSAYVHEKIFIHVRARNPLSIPIQLCQAHVFCRFYGEDSTEFPAEKKPYDSESYDITLKAKEERDLVFEVVCNEIGTLRLVGLAFNLFGQIWGQKKFMFELPKGKGAPEPGVLDIQREMPLLRVEMDDTLQRAIYEGEIIQKSFKITNVSSSKTASGICMIFSHPQYTLFDETKNGQKGLFTPRKPLTEMEKMRLVNNDSQTLDWFDVNCKQLGPGESIELPFRFRVFHPPSESFVIHMSVMYGMQGAKADDNIVRFSHKHIRVNIQKLLKADFLELPNAASPESILLNLRVANLEQTSNVHVDHITCTSKHWKLSPMLDLGEEYVNIYPNCVSSMLVKANLMNKKEPEFSVVSPMGPDNFVMEALDSEMMKKELYTRWEDLEFGDGGNWKKKKKDEKKDPSMGLPSFGPMPSFAGAHSRIKDENAPCEPPQMNITSIYWHTVADEPVNGLTHIFIPCSYVPQTPLFHGMPLRVSLEYEPRVEHHFASTLSWAHVPVKVRLRNFSLERSYRVQIDPVYPDESQQMWQAVSANCSEFQFLWSGTSSFATPTLIPPREEVCHDLTACFSGPGTFNINSLLFTVYDASGKNLASFLMQSTQQFCEIVAI